MAPFFKKSSDALPSELAVSWDQITKWWEYWLLWRFSERRAESFVLIAGWDGPFPKSMSDTFAELDGFYGKMEAQKLKEDSKKNGK
jgi:hypothetical protein